MPEAPFTPYHTKYLAYQLTRRVGADQADKLAQSLSNATVDLNPHQVDAALFAFRSPLSRGAILADEVGLGKTIEAGIIISQLWAEKSRRILVIAPASLRKQWSRELVSFVDEHVFGSEEAFRELYAKKSDSLSTGVLANLRARLAPICQRTLRKQVFVLMREA